MLFFLKLRCLQLGRLVADLGILRCMIWLFFGGALLFQAAAFLRGQPLAGLAIGCLPALWHWQRQDLAFLQVLLPNFRLALVLEYACLNLPILAFMLFIGAYPVALGITVLTAILPLIPSFSAFQFPQKKQKRGANWWLRLNFEAWVGIRRFWPELVLVYILMLLTLHFEASLFVGLVILTVFLGKHYNYQEDYWVFQKRFERSQITSLVGRQLFFLQIFFAPARLCFLFHHADIWYLLLPEMLFTSVLMAFAVVYKYSVFWPDPRETVSNSLPMSLFLMGLCVPFFIPVCLWQLIVRWQKARYRIRLLTETV